MQADGQAVSGGQGVGVVLAQHAAAAGQGVFAQLPGRLVLAGVTNAGGQAAGGGQGAGVPADRTQADGQAVGGGQGVGVVLAQDAAAAWARVSSSSSWAARYPLAARRLTARLLAEARVSGWSSPRAAAAGAARVSSSSCTCALPSSLAIRALSPRRRVRAKLPGCRYPGVAARRGQGDADTQGPAATARAPRRSSGIAALAWLPLCLGTTTRWTWVALAADLFRVRWPRRAASRA